MSMTGTPEAAVPPPDAAWRRTWESYKRSWLRNIKARQLSANTLRIYGGCADLFIAHLATLPPDQRPADVAELTRAHVEDFLGARGDHGDAPSYIHQHWRNLRAWLNYLVKDEEIDKSPLRGLSEPTVPKKSIPVVPDDQITALFTVCRGRGFAEVRDTAIIRLLFSTGGRRAEVGTLEVDDVDLENDEIHVLGKGRKDRRIPFGAKTGQALDKYLRARARQRWAHLPNLWLSTSGRGALSPSGIGQMLERRARQAGIEHVHPHLFRHKLAHDWQAQEGNERDLKRIMGWESDAMLERYAASAAGERARASHRRMRLDDRL